MKFLNSKYADYTLLLIVLIVGLWQLYFFQAVMKWDAVDISLPWKFYNSEAINNGLLPLWNPFVRNGFAQMGETSNWYVISWVIGFFKRYDLTALHFEYFFHLYIAGVGFYKLGKSFHFSRKVKLLLAISYMFCGFFIGNAQHLGWIVSASWVPFVLYYFVRLYQNNTLNYAIKLSLVLFLMLSGGYPGMFIIIAYILLGIFIYFFNALIRKKDFKRLKRWVLFLALSTIIFIGLSAVILVSSFDLSEHITRGSGLDNSSKLLSVIEGSLPLKSIITFGYSFLASFKEYSFWGSDFSLVNLFIGIVPLLFIGFVASLKKEWNIRITLIFIASILFLCIAMGEVFPFRKWLTYLPFMNLFRFPAIFRLFTIVGLLIVSGYGLETFIKNPNYKKRLISIGAFVCGGLLLVQGVLFFKVPEWNFSVIDYYKNYNNISTYERAFWSGLIVFVFVTIIIFALKKYTLKKALFTIIIVGIFDMLIAVQLNGYGTVYDKYNLDKINYKISQVSENYISPSLTQKISEITDKELQKATPYLWRNLGMIYKTTASDGYGPYVFNSEKQAQNAGCYESILSNPILFLADNISNGIVDDSAINYKSNELIKWEAFNPNKIEITVNNTQKTNLILLQNIYPHWEAEVNGKTASINTVNKTFMFVKLNEGTNNVLFQFKPKNTIYAFYVSAILFVACVLYLLINLFIHQKSNKKSLAIYILIITFFSGIYFIQAQINYNNYDELKAGKSIVITKNDFEQLYKNWSQGNISKSTAFSGDSAEKLDSTITYGSTYKNKSKNFLEDVVQLDIEGYFKYEEEATPQIVFQVDRDGKNIYWKNKLITTTDNNEWDKVKFSVDLSSLSIESNDEIAIYIWNENRKNVWVDNLTISAKY